MHHKTPINRYESAVIISLHTSSRAKMANARTVARKNMKDFFCVCVRPLEPVDREALSHQGGKTGI